MLLQYVAMAYCVMLEAFKYIVDILPPSYLHTNFKFDNKIQGKITFICLNQVQHVSHLKPRSVGFLKRVTKTKLYFLHFFEVSLVQKLQVCDGTTVKVEYFNRETGAFLKVRLKLIQPVLDGWVLLACTEDYNKKFTTIIIIVALVFIAIKCP